MKKRQTPNVMWGLDDPDGYVVRRIQPYEAMKMYICPSCNRDIPPRTGHYVVVPNNATDMRRHWHRGCWDSYEKKFLK